MSKTSERYFRNLAAQYMESAQKASKYPMSLLDQLYQFSLLPKPKWSEEEALGYLPEAGKLGYGEIMNWLQGKPGTATAAEGLINEILAGALYDQPGMKSTFAKAIENPIMEVLKERTMPQIAASAGKGGTYFSTMRGNAEIEAMQDAADKIAELEGGYILDQMTSAMETGLALPGMKAAAGIGAADYLRGSWEHEQPYWGGGNVPLIQSILDAANQTLSGYSGLAGTGSQIAMQDAAISSAERQARMAGITSGFGSLMGAGGQVGGAAAGSGKGCCFMFIMGEGGITDMVQKFKHSFFPYHSDVANGYRWMSLKLMPYIRKNRFVKFLVRNLVTKPLSKFADHYYKKNPKGYLYAPAGLFWGTTWALLGRINGYNSDPYQNMVKELGI